ncbi:MAG: nicotinate (nicotinamide) nucleotide adenylyltransferase [Verrucomicrobiota bacterium]|jgi:nicotinate-nucleotide adenylyltransferase
MMRLGLYGGSFDPVHWGHVLVARAALEELELDRVVFIPAARSPFKPSAAPAPDTQRLRWLRLALAGEPRFVIDDVELRRGGTSYTVDTVRAVLARHPGARLAWLIGADHVPTLPQWREAAELARLVEFVVIPRPGSPVAPAPAPFRVRELRGWPLSVSSSEIRDRVRAGLAVAHLVPPHVAEAIRESGAYA